MHQLWQFSSGYWYTVGYALALVFRCYFFSTLFKNYWFTPCTCRHLPINFLSFTGFPCFHIRSHHAHTYRSPRPFHLRHDHTISYTDAFQSCPTVFFLRNCAVSIFITLRWVQFWDGIETVINRQTCAKNEMNIAGQMMWCTHISDSN